MHAVDPYPCRRPAAASSDDLLRASVDTAARAPARSPSPLFRPFTRAGWQHAPADTGSRTGGRARTSNGHKGSLSVGTGTRAGGAPPLTPEEFEALPVAIQRKYFSTLERLRFVQGSGHVDGIVQHYSAITAQNAARRRRSTVTAAAAASIPIPPPPAACAAATAAAAAAAAAAPAAPKTRRTASRSVSDTFASRLRKRSMRDLPSAAVAAPDSAFYASLPDKIKKRAFTPEEQVMLSGHQSRFQSRPRPHPLLLASTGPDITLDTPLSATFSIFSDGDFDPNDSLDGNNSTPATPTTMATPQPRTAIASSSAKAATIARKRTSGVPDSFYDSFQCLEDGDGLDLSLSLDDYHANLRAAARPVPKMAKPVSPPPLSPTSATSVKERRPSTAFRRHLSISKMAFHSSNNGSSSARPATTTMPSSGRSSPLAFSSSSSPPPPPQPQTASHTGPSSPSLVPSPSLSSLSPTSSAPPPTAAEATTAAAPAPVSVSPPTAPAVPPSSSSLKSHTRRKSRAMSLITPSSSGGSGLGSSSSTTKHATHSSMSSAAIIDPAAAHYQDPEARLKLRVYLSSPQKFDEAIQFGFPAAPILPETAATSDPLGERRTTTSHRKRTTSLSVSSPTGAPRPGSPTLSTSSPLTRTITASARDRPSWDGVVDKSKPCVGDKENSTTADDDQLLTPADPDSPKTPDEDEAADAIAVAAAAATKQTVFRPYRVPPQATDGSSHGHSKSSNGPPPASSREMTLRMTLTRLDLRAAEDQMYGWQQTNQSHHLGHSYQHSRKLSLGGGGGIVLGSGNGNAGIRKMAGIAPVSSASSSSSGLPSSVPSFTPAAAARSGAGPTSMPTTPRVTYIGASSGGPGLVHEQNSKESIEQVFAGIDQWGDLDTQEKGVMKRFWNRVRRV